MLNRRLMIANAGFIFIAFGIVLVSHSGLGANSWNVLHIGLSLTTPLSLGQSIQVVSISLVAINWCMGERPGLATILKMVLVGLIVDGILYLGIVPAAQSIFLQVLFMLGGTVCMGFGSALYIKTGLGRGPRDGFMFVLKRLTNWSLVLVRTAIELAVLFLGILLKGPFGIGSIVITLMFGWVMQGSFSLLGYLENKGKLTTWCYQSEKMPPEGYSKSS